MNILPKKSWHVRTKQNIARVRRDEAKAAEEEKETQRRIALAAQEARTALLRERASQRANNTATATCSAEEEGDKSEVGHRDEGLQEDIPAEQDLRFGIALGSLKDVIQPDGHVNFFQDVEAGKRQGGTTNEEHEQEKKKEQDDYEKKIGYLVFLGQDSLEQSKEKPWYAKIDRGKPNELEKELEQQRELDRAAGTIGGLEEKSKSVSAEDIKMTKFKSFLDPLKDIRKYLGAPKKLQKPTDSQKEINNRLSPLPEKKRKMSCSSDDAKNEKRKSKKEKHKRKHRKSSKKSKKSHRRKHSPESGHSSSSDDEDYKREGRKREALENLRRERLQREREERRRAEQVLAKLRGESDPSSAHQLEISRDKRSSSSSSGIPSMASVKQKYNSQFNPHLARQNYD